MTNTAVIRDAYGTPAMFVDSKTGKDDAAFVFIRVGDEELRVSWAGLFHSGRSFRSGCTDCICTVSLRSSHCVA